MPTATAPPPTVDALVDATPASRDRAVDFLRALAIGVVVLWHWVFSVTHWTDDGRLTMPNPIGDVPGLWLVTWLLQVMPLFFVVGGVANRAAWTAAQRDGRPAYAFVVARLRRLGRPCAVLVGAWAAFEVAAAVIVRDYPGVLSYGRVVFVPLWFLGVYAAVVALVPVTATLHARRPGRVLATLLGAVALADLGRLRYGLDVLGPVSTLGVWLFAHQLGYWWRDGTLLRGGRRTAARVAGVGLAALAALVALGPYPRSMVAVRGEAVSNMLPTTLCIAALAVLQLGVALWLRDPLNRWLRRRRPWRAVVAVNGVAMTVFCWHMTALLLAIAAWELLGGTLAAQPTATWWALRPLWLLLPALFLAPFVAVLGPRERPRVGRYRGGRYDGSPTAVAPAATSTISRTATSAPSWRPIAVARRAAPSRSRRSSSAATTAARIRRGDADRGTMVPAPASATRRAPSGWSRPPGMHTRGTPHESAAFTVPHPAWVTTSEAWGNTERWGTNGVTTVFGPGLRPEVSSAGPAVSSTRASTPASASSTRRARSSCRM